MSMHNANLGSPQGGYSAEPPTGLPDTGHHGARYTHRRATPALVCGVLSLLLGLVTGIPAIVMAGKAIRDINDSEGQIAGRGIAWAAMALGLIGTTVSLVALAGWALNR